MNKSFIGITFLFIGFVAGLLTTATLIEYEINRINKPIDSAILLEIPKTDFDLSMSIIYQEAELAMLKEIQRQKGVKIHETSHATTGPVRVRSRTQR